MKRHLQSEKSHFNRVSPTEFLDFLKKQKANRNFGSVSPNQLNFKQKLVYDFITLSLKNKHPNLLICHGEAGTGKSFIIAALRPFCEQKKIQFRVMAFTGCAAFAVGGQTIHSTLSIPIYYRKHVPENHVDHPRNYFKNVKLLIIDELSMIGLSLFGYMERRLKAIYANNEPFGGITILMMGDFSQLRPVGEKSLFYKSDFLTDFEKDGSLAYSHFKHCIILDDVMRQGSNESVFKKILSRVRIGNILQEDLDALKTRCLKNINDQEAETFLNAPLLYGDNATVEKYNDYRLENVGNEILELKPICSRNMDDSNMSKLRVCVGSRVSITKNLYITGGIYNGCQGMITEISADKYENGLPKFIFVKLDRYFGPKFQIRNDIPFVPLQQPFYDPIDKKTHTIIQYPFRLSFASTVHKAQGQTYERAVIGLPSENNTCSLFYIMSPQLFYVAIGRVKTLKGLCLTENPTKQLVNEKSTFLKNWMQEIQRLKQMEIETIQMLNEKKFPFTD